MKDTLINKITHVVYVMKIIVIHASRMDKNVKVVFQVMLMPILEKLKHVLNAPKKIVYNAIHLWINAQNAKIQDF